MSIAEFVLATGIIGIVATTMQHFFMWWVQRRASKKDGEKKSASQRLTDMESLLENLAIGQRAILHDRIKWLGMEYTLKKGIGLDNRKDLIEMHGAYKALGGNGNLNALMEGVLRLPLKED